jgi:hypothetical protein
MTLAGASNAQTKMAFDRVAVEGHWIYLADQRPNASQGLALGQRFLLLGNDGALRRHFGV